jgi:IclR family transcriptional regulator, pca regulon regulatory protein
MITTPAAEGASVPLGRLAAAEPDNGANRHGDPQFMTSLARGLLVIRAFAGSKRERTIAHLSRTTGLSRAAVRRCLYTLCELGYARRSGHTYRLLPKVLTLGQDAVLPTGAAPGV